MYVTIQRLNNVDNQMFPMIVFAKKKRKAYKIDTSTFYLFTYSFLFYQYKTIFFLIQTLVKIFIAE